MVRREGFHHRYGGLRYDVRRSAWIGSTRYDIVRRWEFDLVPGDRIWADRRGPVPGSGLEPWTGGGTGLADLACRIDGLAVLPEASGRFHRWLLSGHVAVHEFGHWPVEGPRRCGIQIWTRAEEGRRQLAAAAERRR